MANVEVSLGGRSWPITCDDGQEERVRQLAGYVEGKLSKLRSTAPSVSDMHLLVMVSLLLADELFDARTGTPSTEPLPGLHDVAAAETIARLAGRLESLAARLEQA